MNSVVFSKGCRATALCFGHKGILASMNGISPDFKMEERSASMERVNGRRVIKALPNSIETIIFMT